MGVDHLPSGSCRARLMVDGQTYTATFATEAEACEWVVVTRGRVVGARVARTLTLEEYAHRWPGEFIDTAHSVTSEPIDIYSVWVSGYKVVEATMTKRLIDIDDDTLAQATDILGAVTMKDTVNRALLEVVLLAERRSHADRLASMDGLDLDDEQIMAGAWR